MDKKEVADWFKEFMKLFGIKDEKELAEFLDGVEDEGSEDWEKIATEGVHV